MLSSSLPVFKRISAQELAPPIVPKALHVLGLPKGQEGCLYFQLTSLIVLPELAETIREYVSATVEG
jgi:hypothetical protein